MLEVVRLRRCSDSVVHPLDGSGRAVNTVGRAYTELETAGLIVSRRRTGTVVTATGTGAVPDHVRSDAARLARSAAAAKLTTEQAVDLLRSAMLSAV